MIKLNDLKDEINFKFHLNMSTTAFQIKLKCDIPLIETVIYGASKHIYIKPISEKTLLDFYIKKGFWCNVNDVFESNLEDNGLDDEPVTAAQIIKNQAQIIKQLQDTLLKERENREMFVTMQKQNAHILLLEEEIKKQNSNILEQLNKLKMPEPVKESEDEELFDEEFEQLFISGF